MFMFPNNETYPPHMYFRTFHPIQTHSNQTLNLEECAPQVSAKLKTFHVEIRNHELKEYKKKIRNEFLSSSKIDELLEQMPTDNEVACLWAHKLAEEYARTYKYNLPTHRAVEIFKTAQKFPNKQTLELLEIIVLRASIQTINNIFQYDMMRLLHGFINFTGSTVAPGRMQATMEQVEIIKEVVITTASKYIQRSSNSAISHLENCELARITIRIISHLCKKQEHIRNFAVLSHKTFTYCLKAYSVFGENIKLEFYMFLEAVTFFQFSRYGELQFRRISKKVIDCFFQEKMNIKIQLFDEDQERSCLKVYEFIMLAVKNLLQMKNIQLTAKILEDNGMGQLKIIPILTSLVSQCNYVLSYPAVLDKREEILPLHILAAAIELILNIKDYFDRQPFPGISCNLEQIYKQYLLFLQFKNHSITYDRGIVARRGIYFMLYNLFYENLTQQDIISLIYFNGNEKENLISLLAFYLQNQGENLNLGQLGKAITAIFENMPAHIIQPLLIPSEIIVIMIEAILNPVYSNDGQQLSNIVSSNNIIMEALVSFFQYMGQNIGSRISLYKDIVNNYSDRLESKYDNQGIQSKLRQMVLTLISLCKSEGDVQSL